MVSRAIRSVAIAAFAGSCLAEQMLTPNNGLQALNVVEQTLHKMLGASTDKALLKIAAPVVEVVDKAVQEVESGHLTKKASAEKVLFAIKAMQGLQDQLEKAKSGSDKMDTMQKELAAKKAELAKEQGLTKKLDEMKEKLAEKQQELVVITKEKEAAASHQKDQQENSQEASMVAGLVKMARDLAKSAPKNMSKADVAKNVSKVKLVKTVPKPLQAILKNLQDQAHNVSADLKRIDAEEKIREDKLDKLAATKVPVVGFNHVSHPVDAIDKGSRMIKQLEKQEQRSYKKNRALKQTQLNELNDGINAVETGDVAALSTVMNKMQTEVKTLSSKGFLH